MVSNAVRHTKEGSVVLEWGLYDDTNTQAVVKGADDVVMAFVVADTGFVILSCTNLPSLTKI